MDRKTVTMVRASEPANLKDGSLRIECSTKCLARVHPNQSTMHLLIVPALESLLPILAIAFVAGLIQGLSGFGSSLIAVPLLSLLLPIETVVPLMTLLAILISVFNLMHLHHAIRLQPIIRLLIGYSIGTPLGLFVLTRAPEAAMLGTLGAFLTGYALLSLSGRQPKAPWLRKWRIGLGIVSGALGAGFGTNGPPVILHVAAHPEWDADRQKATLVLFFLLSSGITIIALALGGLVTNLVLRWFAWSVPMLIVGAHAGTYLYRKLGPQDYRRLTFAFILISGGSLLWRALFGAE